MKKGMPDLTRAVPPMPDSFVKRMDDTLKEIETMKKRNKFTVALIAAIIAVLALASAAVAQAVDSGILGRLFGEQEPPQQAAELLQTDVDAAQADGISLTVDELLFDGRNINCQWTVSSDREEAVFAAIDWTLNGADGAEFRTMSTSANFGDHILFMLGRQGGLTSLTDLTGYVEMNYADLLTGDLSLTLTATVYTTHLTPVLTGMNDAGEIVFSSQRDESDGGAAMWTLLEEAGQLGVVGYGSDDQLAARMAGYPSFLAAEGETDPYAASGLMEPLTAVTVTVPVTMNNSSGTLSVFGPETFDLADCTLEIVEAAFSPVSVTMDMRIYPKSYQEGESFFDYRVFAAADGKPWYLNLEGEALTDENGAVYFDVALDGPPVTEIPDEIVFIRVGERLEGESPSAHYERLLAEAGEGGRAVLKLK